MAHKYSNSIYHLFQAHISYWSADTFESLISNKWRMASWHDEHSNDSKLAGFTYLKRTEAVNVNVNYMMVVELISLQNSHLTSCINVCFPIRMRISIATAYYFLSFREHLHSKFLNSWPTETSSRGPPNSDVIKSSTNSRTLIRCSNEMGDDLSVGRMVSTWLLLLPSKAERHTV